MADGYYVYQKQSKLATSLHQRCGSVLSFAAAWTLVASVQELLLFAGRDEECPSKEVKEADQLLPLALLSWV